MSQPWGHLRPARSGIKVHFWICLPKPPRIHLSCGCAALPAFPSSLSSSPKLLLPCWEGSELQAHSLLSSCPFLQEAVNPNLNSLDFCTTPFPGDAGDEKTRPERSIPKIHVMFPASPAALSPSVDSHRAAFAASLCSPSTDPIRGCNCLWVFMGCVGTLAHRSAFPRVLMKGAPGGCVGAGLVPALFAEIQRFQRAERPTGGSSAGKEAIISC